MRILVADDTPSVRRLLRLILEPKYEVVEAEDGNAALQKLLEYCPPVAILDVSMPGRSGLDVCRALRENPRLASTGVIVVTANGTPHDRSAAFEAGADYFLTKPFSPIEIVEHVEALVRRHASTVAEP